MKLFWIYGKYPEDFWIATAEDVEGLFLKYSKEANVTIEWARENCTWSEIDNIDGYKVSLEKST